MLVGLVDDSSEILVECFDFPPSTLFLLCFPLLWVVDLSTLFSSQYHNLESVDSFTVLKTLLLKKLLSLPILALLFPLTKISLYYFLFDC